MGPLRTTILLVIVEVGVVGFIAALRASGRALARVPGRHHASGPVPPVAPWTPPRSMADLPVNRTGGAYRER